MKKMYSIQCWIEKAGDTIRYNPDAHTIIFTGIHRVQMK